jgi:DNA-binding HxlR family transcriptional regulator
MRYSELKNATGLPSGTLDRRLGELIKMGLVRQKPLKTQTGRYRLIYEVENGAREVLRGIQIFVAEEKLKKAYLDAVDDTAFSDEEKRILKKILEERFRDIIDTIAIVYLQALSTLRKRKRNR